MNHTLQRELDHAARWVSIYKGKGDTMRADRWQNRWDAINDQIRTAVAVAGDGEVIGADQSPWVQDQADATLLAEISENPARGYAVNRRGRAERVIKRIRRHFDDDGDDPKPIPV